MSTSTPKDTLVLTDEQKIAVHSAQQHRVMALVGGAGVGKTTCLRVLAEILTQKGTAPMFLAPTGKASARISQQTGRPASTIHRALGWEPVLKRPQFDSITPWPARHVIIDESSMVDAQLCSMLLNAVREDGYITFVGDPNQLPPVGPGEPFVSMIRSGVVPVCRLSVIQRQAASSPIIMASSDVLRGVFPKNGRNEAGAFSFSEVGTDSDLITKVMSLVKHGIPKAFGLSSDEDIQVLTATKSLAEDMCDELAHYWNPAQQRSRFVKPGDKVIHIKNNYELNVYNGDVGRCLARGEWGAEIDYDGRIVRYPAGVVRREVQRAFALTTHKSQGSEYPVVIVALDASAGRLLHRQLIYTAITRAKLACIVVGTKRIVGRAITTEAPTRMSLLDGLLKNPPKLSDE